MRHWANGESNRAARMAREAEERESERAAWRASVAPVVIACGVRPSLIDVVVDQAHSLFDLREGKLVAKSGVTNRRDPCADYTVVDWLADLHASDENLLWERQK
jgi:hypothetical protein